MSFWSVHEHVQPFLDLVGSWPQVGSPAWCALEEGPVRLAALLDAAQHWALRLELCQEARAQASQAIAGALDWPEVSREIHARSEFYAARPWLKRAAS
ncbi:hypothetical protein A5732_16790 [Mycobacterium colombiense]|nr:hypothetical protein A5732_16790 [Mycobacterium colombiense]